MYKLKAFDPGSLCLIHIYGGIISVIFNTFYYPKLRKIELNSQ